MERFGRACGIAAVVVGLCLPGSGAALQTTIGGRAIEIDGQAELREVIEENHATPHDRTQELLRLRAAAQLTPWLRLDTTTVGLNGGPTFKATKSGTFNMDDTFQDVSPSVELEEAYLDAHFAAADIRVGKQKFAWGKLDRFQPNDFINPERFVDPFLQEEDERKIGVPAVSGSYYLPEREWLPQEGRFTVVWAPQYVPFRLPAAGERWFPPAATPPSTFTIPPSIATLPNGAPIVVPLRFRTANSPTPAARLENGNVAVRVSGLLRQADVALYYYHGFDVQPAFSLSAVASGRPDPQSPLGADITDSQTILAPVYRQIDSWGADVAYPLGDFTLRAEGAYNSGRPFSRDLRVLTTDPTTLIPQIARAIATFRQHPADVTIDLGRTFVTRETVEWGLGADYSMSGYLVLLQVNQTDLLHNDVDLLIHDVETRLLANLRKTFLADKLQMQFLGLYGIESDYTILLPRVTYQLTDGVDVRVGYLFIAGRSNSIGGQFKRNDEAFVRLRYSF